jgi:hypothetical protein
MLETGFLQQDHKQTGRSGCIQMSQLLGWSMTTNAVLTAESVGKEKFFAILSRFSINHHYID